MIRSPIDKLDVEIINNGHSSLCCLFSVYYLANDVQDHMVQNAGPISSFNAIGKMSCINVYSNKKLNFRQKFVKGASQWKQYEKGTKGKQ